MDTKLTKYKSSNTKKNNKKWTETNYNQVTFYDIQPGNGEGLFSKEKIHKNFEN